MTEEEILAALSDEESEESAEATPEETGEQEVEEAEQVADEESTEESEPTAPAEKTVPLKAVQEERRKRQEAREEAEYWKRIATGEQQLQAAQQNEAKPTPAQFDDYDAYVEALADYKARQIFRSEQERTRTVTREELAKREEQRLHDKAKRDAEDAARRYSDFYEVAGKVQLPPHSLQAMYQSDLGPEIAYYLGKNEAEMERIADLPPARQIMELGKLEVKLASKTAKPETKRTKQPTKVEAAGQGFQPAQEKSAAKLMQLAKSGQISWAEYFERTG